MRKTKGSETKPDVSPESTKLSWLSGFWPPKTRRDRVILISVLVLAVLAAMMAVPLTRYAILGQFDKRDIVIVVTDDHSHKPVADAAVKLGSATAKTDATGRAKFAHVPVGSHDVVINKKYFNLISTHVLVPLAGTGTTFKLQITAIGNQVTVRVVNKITGKPLAKAKIEALGTTTLTDSSGEAELVLPIGHVTEPGTVKAENFNDLATKVTNTEQLTVANTFSLVPRGKVYFLSKRTGIINVMKSDLDGANATVVLAGTGRESDTDTVLLATRDWKYLALKARRDSDLAKLYVINTGTDGYDTMDLGKVDFTLVGWSGHRFVYEVSRQDIQYYQARRLAIKSYDADSLRLKTVYETQAVGDGNYYDSETEEVSTPILVDSAVLFTKRWSGGIQVAGKKMGIYSMDVGSGKLSALKEWDNGQQQLTPKLYKPDELLVQMYDYASTVAKYSYFEVKDGQVTSTTGDNDQFGNGFYPTFLESPSGDSTFWYEPRDGKNALFEGNASGDDSKQVATLSEFSPYGWYTDDYVLVSKSGSELYIAPADFSGTPLKITDYHKPSTVLRAYGGGYGGS